VCEKMVLEMSTAPGNPGAVPPTVAHSVRW
jgi:hypothetical protein